MSAFMCSGLHFSTIARAYAEGAPLPRNACLVQLDDGETVDLAEVFTRDPARGARLLAEQNAASVAFCYQGSDAPDVPDCSPANGKPVPLAGLRVMLECVNYQSCEHDAWRANGWHDAIGKMIMAIPARLAMRDHLGMHGREEFWGL